MPTLSLPIIIAIIIFLAAFQQSLSGFGFALVTMPVLVQLVGLQTAAPLIASSGLLLTIINALRWRKSIDWSEIRRLGVWGMLGILPGILSVDYLPEIALKIGLGMLLVAYSLYALFKPEKLPIISRRWAYPAGFIAGLLGGAYNTPGPPLILYGNLRQWSHQRFRAVLQSVFSFSAALVVGGHLLAGHFTTQVIALMLPTGAAILLGVLAGALLDHHLKPQHLRTWITIVTLILGASLLIPR